MPSEIRDETVARPEKGGRRLVEEFRRRHERRRRLFPRAVLVGALAGLVASLFRALLERGEELRTSGIDRLRPYGFAGFLAFVLIGAALVALAVWLVRRFVPVAAGSGIPHLKAVLYRLRPMPGLRLVGVKFLGGIAGIGAGLALGREGPTIQMGGALGRVVARWMTSTAHERQVLIAAGAGGGLAAAFNAPLAGLVFVLEEIQRNFAPGIFSSTFLACVTADAVSRYLFGQSAVFGVPAVAAPPLTALPLFALLGVGVGVLGVLFNRGLRGGLAFGDRLPERAKVPAAALVGLAVATIAWFSPSLVGGGGRLVRAALAGQGLFAILLLTLAARLLLTLGSYSTGAPGGIFAPLLVLGAQAGLAGALAAGTVIPFSIGEPTAWAVTGMAALFAATVRAPLTGIVLMVEMTEGYALILPLLTATFVAQWVADWLGEPPIYDSLLERDLARGGEAPPPEGSILLELDVLPGAPYTERRVADLGLPRGLLFVAVERRGSSRVPTGETRLAAGDRLSVAVAPEAAGALGDLRIGLGIDPPPAEE